MDNVIGKSADGPIFDQFGYYNAGNHGPLVNHLKKITEQNTGERNFAAVIQSWLRHLLFGDQTEQVDKNYLDLSTFHYPHHKKYLDFMALKEGSVDRQTSLVFKEILLLILLLLDYIRIGLQKLYKVEAFIKLKLGLSVIWSVFMRISYFSALLHT